VFNQVAGSQSLWTIEIDAGRSCSLNMLSCGDSLTTHFDLWTNDDGSGRK
jgi:hypothetical protein